MSGSTLASESSEVFGTTAVLLVTIPAALGPARQLADETLAAVDLACSRFRADSELTRLNASRGATMQVSPTFAQLIATALRAAELTSGNVDPTCARALTALGYDRDFAQVRAGVERRPPESAAGPAPGWRNVRIDETRRLVRLDNGAQLDLGATAKAWAADRCAERIAAAAACGTLVSLGGDIAVAGPAPEEGWQVLVTDDHAEPVTAPGQTVTVVSGGLATSSTAVRSWTAGGRAVHHIIDPATGEPAQSCWRTVSVAAGTCTDANIASTAAIVRGEAAADWLEEMGLPARLVRWDGSVRTTGGWPAG